jgi:LDH2 family malate/lactate/ureidoglycolate dehydrogenase
MSGVLSGAAFGPGVNNLYRDGDPPADVGHCFIVLDVSRWMSLEEYYARMEQFLAEIKASPLARDAEEILYPGERRHRTYLENERRGLALPATVRQELEELAKEYDTEFPARVAAS